MLTPLLLGFIINRDVELKRKFEIEAAFNIAPLFLKNTFFVFEEQPTAIRSHHAHVPKHLKQNPLGSLGLLLP